MSYSSFIFEQAQVPTKTIPYVVVGQGAINVLATIVCVSITDFNPYPAGTESDQPLPPVQMEI